MKELWKRARARLNARDLLAGLTVAAMAVPQSMAVAELCGMPPASGLYAAIFPVLVYAVSGSSRIAIAGPEPTTAMMAAAAIVPFAAPRTEAHAQLMGLLALLVGVVLVLGSVLRLGMVTELLPKPVRIGYVYGVAITLIHDQLPSLTRVPSHAGWIHGPTISIGLGATAIALASRRWAPRFPAALFITVAAIAAVAWLGLGGRGIALAGAVPGGLPVPALPPLAPRQALQLAAAAASIALVTFSDGAISAKAAASRRGERFRPNRELRALGLADLAAAFFHGFPVAISASRTAVADASGGRTQLAGLTSALAVLGVLLWLTGPLALLPRAALSGIIVAAAVGLLDLGPLRGLWRVRKAAALLTLVTAVGVLVLGVLPGIGVAVALAVADLLRKAARPHDAVLGKVEGIDGYHDIKGRARVNVQPGLIAYRFDAPLFFANAAHFRREVRALLDGGGPVVRWLLIDAEAIYDVDSAALEMLEELHGELQREGVTLAFARVKRPLRRRLQRAGLFQRVGEDHFFPTVTSGVRRFRSLSAPGRGAQGQQPGPESRSGSR